MKKRFLSILLAVTMALSLLPATALAAGTGEDALQKAISDAQAGATVTLTENVTLTKTLEINKPLTLDGAGYTISGSVADKTSFISVKTDGDFTMQNCKINPSANVTRNAAVMLDVKGKVTVSNCTFGTETGTNKYMYNALEFGQDTVVADGTVISGNTFYGNTLRHNCINFYRVADNATVTISDNKFNNLDWDTTNAIRISNYGSNTATIDLTGNSYDDHGTAGGEAYAGLMLFQNNVGSCGKLTVNVSEQTFTSEAKQLFYVYEGNLDTDSPVVTGDSTVANLVANDAKSPAFVAQVGDTYYSTLAAAVESAQAGDTVTVLNDIKLSKTVVVDKAITLNLNKKEIAATDVTALEIKADTTVKLGTVSSNALPIYVNGAVVTVEDAIINGTGNFGIQIGTNADKNEGIWGGAVINGTVTGANFAGVAIFGPYHKQNGDAPASTLTVDGGTISGKYYGIAGNGNWDDTQIILNRGTIKATDASDNAAIYHPQAGTLEINDGVIVEGLVGLQVGAGDVTINGGQFKSTDTSERQAPYKNANESDGNVLDGSALSIVSRAAYGPIAITVKGGTFTTSNAANPAVNLFGYVKDADGWKVIEPPTTVTKAITGGSYSSDVSKLLDSEQYAAVKADNGLFVVVKANNTITFNANGGTEVDSATVKLGEKLTKPTDPTKANYTFAGWYTDEELTQAYDFEAPVTSSFTLYAKWVSDTVAVESVTLDKDSAELTVGEKLALTATVTPDNATDKTVTWSSNNETVATVDKEGLVTAVAAGVASITAKAGEVTASCAVSVKDKEDPTVAVTGITLDKTSAELAVEGTLTLKATVTPDNATDKTVTWTSSDEKVATVENGVVTAVAAGDAVITAKAGGFTATCAVTVKDTTVNVVVPAPDTKPEVSEDLDVTEEVKDQITQAVGAVDTTDLADQLTDTAKQAVTEEVAAKAVDELTKAGIATEETKTIVVVPQTTIEITATDYKDEAGAKSFTVDITPKLQLIATTDADDIKLDGGDKNAVALGEAETVEITQPVELTIPVPTDLFKDVETATIFVKHVKDGDKVYFYNTEITDNQVKFTNPHGFSAFTVLVDTRAAKVEFTKADASKVEATYTPAEVGSDLPTDSKSGYTFNGWKFAVPGIEESVYTVMDDTLLTVLSDYAVSPDTVITATSDFSRHSGGGGGGGSSSASVNVVSTKNGDVTVSPKNASKGDKVTITTDPDKGYEVASVVVTDRNGDKISVNDLGNGKYTFTMPSGKVDVKVTFQPSGWKNPFDDVSSSAWYYTAVQYAVENGLFAGTSEDTFGPDDTMTRAMLVQVLYSLSGSKDKNVSSFTDVAANAWYANAVAWAQNNGIVSGVSATQFAPDQSVTREQIAAILARYAAVTGKTLPTGSLSFADADQISDYAKAGVAAMQAAGIVNGKGNNLFAPQADATRAEVATMLMQFVEYKG